MYGLSVCAHLPPRCLQEKGPATFPSKPRTKTVDEKVRAATHSAGSRAVDTRHERSQGGRQIVRDGKGAKVIPAASEAMARWGTH